MLWISYANNDGLQVSQIENMILNGADISLLFIDGAS